MRTMRVAAIARKEFIHVIRDPRSLAMGIAIPMLLIVLFGYALTLDVDNVPMVVWDQDSTHSSRELVSRFQGSRYFSIRDYIDDYAELERYIDSGKAGIVLVIPPGFSIGIESGRQTSVQLIVDGSDSNTATIVIGYADAVLFDYGGDVAAAFSEFGGRKIAPPVDFRPRAWYNPDLESRNYIIPGLIAVIMMVIAALMTSLTIAREWERGSMERLISTPVRTEELILGKLIPYFSIGMLDVALAVLMGEFLFQVPLRGTAAFVFLMAAIFLAGALGLGMLISIVTKSQLLASQLAMVLTFLPSFLLSGFMYAISNMPVAVQIITHLVPARYFVSLLKGIYLKGIGLEILWLQAALLLLFGIGILALGKLKLKKKLG
ncbi:MAG: ABC transporter permease [Candidatus Abyssobacteria bacterium SURF_5]|uniref:ABC transporter permease n=1 Tax=Abyssobacteria bacterium (strain SURF_5) TaxID=2093360 RepID=A0A3A4P280_ABYX5|nr:MAG: ABC transporter permease [Candidatus Abyssubacteria bacterium SURF_5]